MACDDCRDALVTDIDRGLDYVQRVQRNQAVVLLLTVTALAGLAAVLLRKGVLAPGDLGLDG